MPYRTPAIPGDAVTCAMPSSAVVDRRHRRRTAVAFGVSGAAFAAFAICVVTWIPRLGPDDVEPIERVIYEPPRRFMFMSTDPYDFASPSDAVIRGTIALRSHKSPLERIARAPR